MARQVLTLPDVPSTLLTQSVAAATYLPLSHAPGTDPHTQYLTTGRGDLRYSLLAHNHDAAYAPTVHNHDAAYVNTTGNDAMAGNLGVGATLQTWDTTTFSAIQVGAGGALYGVRGTTNETVWLSSNSYISPASAGDKPMVGDRPAARIQITGGVVTFQTALSVAAGVAQSFTPTIDINQTGNVDHHAAAVDSASYRFRSPDATWANIQFSRNDGTPRFLIGADPTQKNFSMHTYADDGAYLGGLFTFERLTRIANFSVGVTTPYIVVNGQVRYNTTTSMGMEGPNWVFRDAQGRNRMVAWDAGNTSFSGDISAGNVSASGTLSASQNCYVTGEMAAGYSTATHCYMRNTGIYNGGGNLSIQASSSVVLIPNNTAAGGYIHPAQDNGTYLGHPSIRWLTVYTANLQTENMVSAGQMGIVGGSHVIVSTGAGYGIYLRASAHVWFDGNSSNGQVSPEIDNRLVCGGVDSHRWKYVSAVNGTIQTSHASFKENFRRLDGGECATAVLETDWVGFEYLPTPDPDPDEDEEPQRWLRRRDDHRKEQARDAFVRKQKGYVLGHPGHKVSNLFGLEDREHTSVSADLAVVACALQSALKRIAVLEEKLSV